MIHLVWSSINLIILLYFFYLIIGFIAKGKNIFNSQIKIFSIVLMVIGLFQVISSRKSDENANRIVFTEGQDTNCSYEIKSVKLEDNFSFDIEMSTTFCRDGNEFKATETYSNTNGFVTGFEWEYQSAEIFKNNISGKTEYNVSGILTWNLFGISVYNQSKIFKGAFN